MFGPSKKDLRETIERRDVTIEQLRADLDAATLTGSAFAAAFDSVQSDITSTDARTMEEIEERARRIAKAMLIKQEQQRLLNERIAEYMSKGLSEGYLAKIIDMADRETPAVLIMLANQKGPYTTSFSKFETAEQLDRRRADIISVVATKGLIPFEFLHDRDELEVVLYEDGTVDSRNTARNGLIDVGNSPAQRTLRMTMMDPLSGSGLIKYDSWNEDNSERRRDHSLPEDSLVTVGLGLDYDGSEDLVLLPEIHRGSNIMLIHGDKNYNLPGLEVGWLKLAGQDIL